MMPLFKKLFSLPNMMLDIVLPPRCLVTGERVDRQGMITPDAWRALTFVSHPFCELCGIPFPFAAHEGGQCVACLKEPPPFDRARSVLVYDDASRDIILRFKHGDQIHTAHTLAVWLQRIAQPGLDTADFLVPVPLHRSRLLKRRYNQAGILSQKLARLAGIPCLPEILIRHKATRPQGYMGSKERHKNVRNAFSLNPRYQKQVKGASVILVDDVYTSGATVKECASVLRQAGAARIDVLTLARVVRPSQL